MKGHKMSSLKASGRLGQIQLLVMWCLVIVVIIEAIMIWFQAVEIDEHEARNECLEAQITAYKNEARFADNDLTYSGENAEDLDSQICSLE
jgi:hypothetical protein